MSMVFPQNTQSRNGKSRLDRRLPVKRETIFKAIGWIGGIYLIWTLLMLPVRRGEHMRLMTAISSTEDSIEKHHFSLAEYCIHEVRGLVAPSDESQKNGWPYSD